MLTFACPSCKKKITTDDSLAGQQGDCPFCKAIITAPGKKPEDGLDAARCSKCGARRQEMKKSCGFCGNPFDGPSPTSTPATATGGPPKTRRAQVPVETSVSISETDRRKLILGGLVVALIAVGAGVFYFTGGDEGPNLSNMSPEEACGRNMILMHFAMQEYMAAKAGPPPGTGSQFWTTILQRDGRTGMLKCPAGSGKTRPSHYRGPGKAFKDLPNDGIIATTFADDHAPGLNILLKDGNYVFAPTGSDLFKKALADTLE